MAQPQHLTWNEEVPKAVTSGGGNLVGTASGRVDVADAAARPRRRTAEWRHA